MLSSYDKSRCRHLKDTYILTVFESFQILEVSFLKLFHIIKHEKK